jgi:radical SAM protein with 4Fe4S-binding SPASM domain
MNPPDSFGLLQFETNTSCNASCTFCNHKYMKRHGEMPLTKIIDLTYHLAYKAKTICPFHMQEPMLEPRLDKILSNVRTFNPHAYIVVYTNMSVYPEQQLENIVKWGLIDNLIVSCYGGTPEQHNTMQPGADYNTVVNNIHKLIKLRDKYRFSTPNILVGYLVTKETKPYIKQFQETWQNIATPTYFRYDSWCGTQPYNAKDEEALWGPPAPRVPCAELYNGQTIHYDGTLVPCCLDYNNSMALGNVFNDYTLWWTNPKLKELRSLHEQGRYDEIAMCKNCSKWRYNHRPEWINQWIHKPTPAPSATNPYLC